MKQISIMIKPASSLCNMRCDYCFYQDESKHRAVTSHGIMQEETVVAICHRINEALFPKGIANISFQGGEPTLAPLSLLKLFVEEMKKYPAIETRYSLQTNGTRMNEEWVEFLHSHRFLVGVSLDGEQKNNDQYRRNVNNESVYQRVLDTIDLLRKKRVEFNVLTVVTKMVARHPEELYQFFRSHCFQYVQLIPCLPGVGGRESTYAMPIEEYACFFNAFFDCWLKGTMEGYPMSVNLFDNVYSLIHGGYPCQCGMMGVCPIQFVVEANGDVYPCDFYCLDDYRMGNVKDMSLLELARSAPATKMRSKICMKKPCMTCKYARICHGGCRRQNVCYLGEETCGYQKVLDHIVPILSRMQ